MEKLFSIKDEKHFVQRTQSGLGPYLNFLGKYPRDRPALKLGWLSEKFYSQTHIGKLKPLALPSLRQFGKFCCWAIKDQQ